MDWVGDWGLDCGGEMESGGCAGRVVLLLYRAAVLCMQSRCTYTYRVTGYK